MPDIVSTPPEQPRRMSRLWQGIAVGAAALALIALIGTIAWVVTNAPAVGTHEGTDQPCGYYWSPDVPYPYIPDTGTQAMEPTQVAAVATMYVEGYPGEDGYTDFDFDANATAYAIYAPTANAHATRCSSLNAEERQTESAQLAEFYATRGAQITLNPSDAGTATPTVTATMTPEVFSYPAPFATDLMANVVIVTATPVGSPAMDAQTAQTPTHTPTPTMTASMAPSATMGPQAPDRPGDPVAAGLTYVADGYLWRIDLDGRPVALGPIRSGTGELDPARAHGVSSSGGDLVIIDVATGAERNLTNTIDQLEEDLAWWPARPDTLVYIYWGASTPDNPTSPIARQLGSINLDGTDRRALGLVGDLGVRNYALGSDGDTLFYIEAEHWVRYRYSDGSRQEYRQENLGLEQLCTYLQGPGLSPDGKWLATRCFFEHDDRQLDGAIIIVDLENATGRVIDRRPLEYQGYVPTSRQVLWSPDMRYVLTAEDSGSAIGLRVVRVEDGQLTARLSGVPELFSPDGKWLVMQGLSTELPTLWYLVDTTTWMEIRPLAVHDWAYAMSWP